MRPITIAAWLVLLNPGISAVSAQTFEASLKQAVARFDTASSGPSMRAGISDLDAIAVKYPDKWASHFYAAYARIKSSFTLEEKGQRDALIDAAESALTRAEKLAPNKEEIFILQAWAAKARLAVDPPDRWRKCNALYDDAIGKAKKMNPENPRIYFLDGQGYFYRPKLWGGGKSKARPYFQTAKQLFAKEDKSDILKPSWGEKANEEFLEQCKN
jgi:hypothetical protein